MLALIIDRNKDILECNDISSDNEWHEAFVVVDQMYSGKWVVTKNRLESDVNIEFNSMHTAREYLAKLLKNYSKSIIVIFPWHGSPTDLATDIAYHLTRDQTKDLINELQRFLRGQPDKFVKENERGNINTNS